MLCSILELHTDILYFSRYTRVVQWFNGYKKINKLCLF